MLPLGAPRFKEMNPKNTVKNKQNLRTTTGVSRQLLFSRLLRKSKYFLFSRSTLIQKAEVLFCLCDEVCVRAEKISPHSWHFTRTGFVKEEWTNVLPYVDREYHVTYHRSTDCATEPHGVTSPNVTSTIVCGATGVGKASFANSATPMTPLHSRRRYIY